MERRGKTLWRRAAALVLSLAMVVTLMPAQYAYAAESEGSPRGGEMPAKLAHFSFDEEFKEGKVDGSVTPTSPSEPAGKTVTATATGTGAEIRNEGQRVGTGALRLSGNTFLTVMGENNDNLISGRERLTFSFWYKRENTEGGRWPFYASKDNAASMAFGSENYIGMLSNTKTTFERYHNGRGYASLDVGAVTVNAWDYITVVMDRDSTQLYLNGRKASERGGAPLLTDILTAGSRLQLGKANWGTGEFYNEGWLDEFAIYEGALTEDQAKTLYDSYFDDVTISFKAENNKVLKTWTEKWYDYTNAAYAYTLQDADKEIVDGENVYIRDEQQTTTTNKEQKKIDITYHKAEVNEVVGTYTADTHPGVAPRNLPEKVEVSLVGTETRVKVPVTWNLEEADYAEIGTVTVNGTAVGKPAQLTLTVKDKEEYLIADYSFDNEEDMLANAVPEGQSGTTKGTAANTITTVDGVVGKALNLPGGDKGTAYVELPDDLLTVDGNAVKDITISMFTKRAEIGYSWPMALLSSGQSSYLALINVGANEGHSDFRAEANFPGGQAKAEYREGADDFEWNHMVIIADSKNHKVTLYKNGQKIAEGADDGFDLTKLAVTGAKNELGHSPFPDKDYKGYIDEFKIYNTVLEDFEIRSITDEVLHRPQLEKAKEALEITYAEGNDENNVTENLNVPTKAEGIGTILEWESSHPNIVKTDGTVMRPSSAVGDTEVTLTATLSIQGCDEKVTKEFKFKVIAMPGISYEALKKEIEDARAKLGAAQTKGIYKDSSLVKLETAIVEAEKIAANEQDDKFEVPENWQTQLDTAVETLRNAAETPMELKDLEELDNSVMLGWYPLTEDANNHIRDIAHGVKGDETTFSREMGATFTGNSALTSAIQMNTQGNITVSDRMTVSFWAYDRGNHRSNALGFGSGDGGKATEHFFYVNTNDNNNILVGMRTNSWHEGEVATTPKVAANTWHHIVCVMDGTMLTLYVDGEEKLTKDMKSTMSQMWTADPDTRHFYIGNCGYAANNDNDYYGSIKDVRLYNVAIASEQVAEIKEFMETRPMEYAKSDLLSAMGSRVVAGKNHLNITESPIELPKTGAQQESIAWSVSPTDPAPIDVNTGAVTFTEGQVTKATLTAKITLNGEEAIVEFDCQIGKAAADVNRRKLLELLEQVDQMALKELDYVPAAWKAFNEVYNRALEISGFAQSQDEVDQAVADLNAALEELEAGKRGDKTELLALIQQANLLKGSNAFPYPESARNDLQKAIDLARSVRTNTSATQAMVDKAVADLQAAIDAFEATVPMATRPAEAEEINALTDKIAEAQTLIDSGKYAEVAVEACKGALELAIEAAAKDGVTKGEIGAAQENLQTAIDALKASADAATSDEKAELTTAIGAAKAVDVSKYAKVSVDAYHAAIANVEKVASKPNVTKGEIDQALADLAAAEAALKDTANPADAGEIGTLTLRLVKTHDMDTSKYSQSAVKIFEAELKRLRGIASKDGVTKGEIAQANADLDAAIAALEKSSGTQGGQEETDKKEAAAALTAFINTNKPAGTQADYTDASWAAYQKALADAQAILKNANATSAQIKAAKEALEKAFKGLTKKGGTTPQPVKVSSIKFAAKSYQIAAGKKLDLNKITTVAPDNASNKNVDFTLAKKDSKYASIKKGVLTTKKAGAGKTISVTATAKDGSGKKATVKVKIMKNAVTKLTVKKKTLSVKPGKKVTIKASVKTNGKNVNKKLEYTSSNKKYATVNSKGVVSAKKAGKGKTVTITVRTTDGSNKSVKVKVKIAKK